MEKGKVPSVNMVTAEVQQVTTQSKTKQSEWEINEAVWKVAKEWVDEVNKLTMSIECCKRIMNCTTY